MYFLHFFHLMDVKIIYLVVGKRVDIDFSFGNNMGLSNREDVIFRFEELPTISEINQFKIFILWIRKLTPGKVIRLPRVREKSSHRAGMNLYVQIFCSNIGYVCNDLSTWIRLFGGEGLSRFWYTMETYTYVCACVCVSIINFLLVSNLWGTLSQCL